jgi:AraC-like DNA-binding protein
MRTLYDTRTVHPRDRYEYFRAGSATELAPVSIHGPAPDRLLAVRSVAKISDFEIEALTWAADREVVVRRTERMIGDSDPACYRILLVTTAGFRVEQADQRVDFRARDIALYDTSQPWESIHPAGPAGQTPTQVVMLTFPRALVPLGQAAVRPLIGTRTPTGMPGHSLIAQFLIELTQLVATDAPDLTTILNECAVGLIRQRLGEPTGITPHTRRLLHRARITAVLRRHLGDPALNPHRIAQAANISPRYLHTLFQDADLPPMQLLKQLRLQQAHRALQDPALARTPVKDIMSAVGYLRADQFARDYRQLFGIPPTQHRHAGTQPNSTSTARPEQ